MGLFDKIVKDAVGGTIGKSLGDAIEKATGIDINNDGQGGENANLGIPQQGGQQQVAQQQQQQQQQQYASQSAASPVAASNEGPKDHAYFAALLAEKFADYNVAEFVPVSVFGSDGKPYDFVLSKDGNAVATIMLTEGNRYRGQDFKNAKAASEAAGVPFINFFLRLPNERGYIINRVKTTLGLL